MILVTPPTEYPVTLDQVRDHLRLDAADDDATVAGYLAAAVQHVENVTGRALMARTYKTYLDAWPSCRPYSVPKPPLISVDHIKTYDDEGAATLWDEAEYYVDLQMGRLAPLSAYSYPAPTRTTAGIEIQWTAGYASRSDVPEDIRHALLMLAGDFFLNRETSGENPAVAALLAPHRIWAV